MNEIIPVPNYNGPISPNVHIDSEPVLNLKTEFSVLIL